MDKHVNKVERLAMVKAMEYICRQMNDEELFMSWLSVGVADGDIEYGDFSIDNWDEDAATCYVDDDKEFADLMGLFLRIMARARKSGGLYCGGVVSD